MKYIMFERPLGKGVGGSLVQKVPIIFPNDLTHSEVAKALLTMKELEGAHPTSAGQVTFNNAQVSFNSSTLNLSSKPEDSELIQLMDHFHGITEKPIEGEF